MLPVTLISFSGIYNEETFFAGKEIKTIDLSSLSGTDMVCTLEAQKIIREQLGKEAYQGIHFIDNGNYHYLTKLFLDELQEDAVLIVFDHHYDCQKDGYIRELTCGNWIYHCRNNAHLKKIVLVGMPRSPKEKELCENPKIVVDDEITLNNPDSLKKLLQIKEKYPVYLSIDKDVLSKSVIETNWDQGSMDIRTFYELLHSIFVNDRVLGVDICGECEDEIAHLKDIRKEDEFNSRLLDLLLQLKGINQ